ncbi:NAD(P)H-binding protein [Enterococcus sp. CSURQ0835]|uniref:NAD(P)H-binding protein n=1 Tax=Enterococcus sp. CSURQ0835 TaxID=2681394 RepID=UPI00135C8E7B|nr:NAD(P)H-binding protein [Enterococcus sp. CSURQ0835]
MKIFVAGATGRVGQELIKELVAKDHFIYAAARHEENVVASQQVQPVHLDLHKEVTAISEDLAEAEAIYFVAGSRGKDLLQTDLYGAVKLMQAAEQRGIKRYIQLSSLFATQPAKWPDSLRDYYIAKFFADRWLQDNTQLDYTILQPGTLLEAPGSGKITTQVEERSENSIENVAAVLAAILEARNTTKKIIVMGDGQTPITEAIQKI